MSNNWIALYPTDDIKVFHGGLDATGFNTHGVNTWSKKSNNSNGKMWIASV